MSLPLPTQVQQQSRLIGSKPRVGISIPAIQEYFSRSTEFEAQFSSGVDGECRYAGDNHDFRSATGDFVNEEVAAGDKLIITLGANAGEHIITSIPSAEILVCSASNFSATTGDNWSVIRRFTDELNKFPLASQTVDQLGGVSAVGSMSFGVSNPDLFSDKFISSGSYPNPENSAVSAELFFDDGSQILTAESIKFFKGIVDSLGTVTYKNCPFKIKNIDAIKGKLVGDLITEADKTGTIPIPASSLGKMKPIIYGDHKFNYGGIESGVTEAVQIANLPGSDIYKNNLSPCVYIGLNSAGKHQYIVAGHALKTIGSAYFRAWTFDSNLNRMVRVDPTQVSYATVGTNVIATVDNNPTVEDFWYPDGTVSGEANVGGGDWETHGNSCDRDFASRSRSELVSGDIRFSKAHIEIDFPDYTNQSASPTAVEVYAKVNYYVTGGVGNDFNALLNTSAFDDITKSGDTRIIFAAETADLAGIENSVSIEHEKATVNTFTSHAYVYMIWKLIKYKLTANASFPLYVACEGREYGTWINGRSTAETDPEGNNYTETHADDDGATNLIENAAGVVESLLVDELGLADTEIFENSFNISSNDLSTSKLSFSILEQIESTKLIDDICKTIKSTYFFNARDLATIRTWVTGDPFSASGDSVPNNNDIYIHKPVKTFVIVTGSNDALDFSDGGAGDLLATIPADSYTGATLATAIDVALEAVGGDNYTVTYSSSTGKFTLVSAGIGPGDFELRWSSGGRAATSIGRFIGFDISADDTGALTYVGDYPLWVDSYVENPTKKPSYKKSTDKIYTDYTIKYSQNHDSGEYQEALNETDTTYISESIPETFLHPYTKDAVTAQIYMDHLKDRYNRKHIIFVFDTWINAIFIEPWDVINCREPLINNAVASYLTKKWKVLNLKPNMSNFGITIEAIEV